MKPGGSCWNCGSQKTGIPAGEDGNGNPITICADCRERLEEE